VAQREVDDPIQHRMISSEKRFVVGIVSEGFSGENGHR
jgi:hypothetical protein